MVASARTVARNEGGQAAVESAIVLPLYIFLLLGILQLSLMHQARLLTKYAAYKAVRAGSLNNGRVDLMEKAALAVLLPMVSERFYGYESIKPTRSASEYMQKWSRFEQNQMPDATNLEIAEVRICTPFKKELATTPEMQKRGFTRGQPNQMWGGGAPPREVDFDDPKNSQVQSWMGSQRTKLSVQVTFYYRMPIPFANWVIHRIARGEQLVMQMRMGADPGRSAFGQQTSMLANLAEQGVFVFPIRAGYTMRMQSNLYTTKAPLPESNLCIVPYNRVEEAAKKPPASSGTTVEETDVYGDEP